MKRSGWVPALLLGAIAVAGLRLSMSSAAARPSRGEGAVLAVGLVGVAEREIQTAI